jgi:hypothetical protein
VLTTPPPKKILYPAKLFLKNEGNLKMFLDRQNLLLACLPNMKQQNEVLMLKEMSPDGDLNL